MIATRRAPRIVLWLALLASAGGTAPEGSAGPSSAPAPRPLAARVGWLESGPGIALHYTIHGRGSRWLVVPLGRLTGDLSALYGSHRVVLYDPRGRGESTGAGEGVPLGLEEDLADLAALQGHLGAERVSLLGMSYYGAMVAVYAARRPERVERVAMLGPMAPTAAQFAAHRGAMTGGEPPEPAAARELRQLREAGMESTDPVGFCRAYQRSLIADLYFDPQRAHLDPALCELPNERPAGIGAWAGRLFATLGEWDLRAEAARVRAPALVVQGAADRITPPAGGRAWAAGMPEARLLLLPEVGHLPLRERREQVMPALLRFLDGSWPEAAERPAATGG